MRIDFKKDAAVKDLDATIKNIQSRVPTILEEIGVTAVGNIRNALTANLPYPIVNTGQLRDSIIFDPIINNTLVVHDGTAYAVWVENGSPPHWIPIKVLITWCKEKKLITNDKDVSIAYAIQHHIAKYGIAPKKFFSSACSLTESQIPEIIRHYYK